jgi:hypothetical protein
MGFSVPIDIISRNVDAKIRTWHCKLPQQTGVKPNPDMLLAMNKLEKWCWGCWTEIKFTNPEPIAVPLAWTAVSPELEVILKRIDHIATWKELNDFLESIAPKDIPNEFK